MIANMYCPKCSCTTHYYFSNKVFPGIEWVCAECLSIWSLDFVLVDKGEDEEES
jgi:hypothetical protein